MGLLQIPRSNKRMRPYVTYLFIYPGTSFRCGQKDSQSAGSPEDVADSQNKPVAIVDECVHTAAADNQIKYHAETN